MKLSKKMKAGLIFLLVFSFAVPGVIQLSATERLHTKDEAVAEESEQLYLNQKTFYSICSQREFAEILAKKFGKSPDDYITEEMFLTTKELSFSEETKGIYTLKGIEYFVNLESLIFNGSEKLDYVGDIEQLRELKYLDLSNNIISYINILNLSNLEYLDLSGNRIADIDLDLYDVANSLQNQKYEHYNYTSPKEGEDVSVELIPILKEIATFDPEVKISYTLVSENETISITASDVVNGEIVLPRNLFKQSGYYSFVAQISGGKLSGSTYSHPIYIMYTRQVLEAFSVFDGFGERSVKVDVNYEDFECIEVDGVEVDSSNYVVSKGSTIVTLKEAFLQTLDDGNYMVEIMFVDALSVETNLVVKRVEPTKPISPSTPNPNVDTSNKVSSAVPTGDTSNQMLFLTLLMGSMTTIAFIKKKKIK